MLFAVSENSLAQVSEIDSYDRAVTSQTKEDALAFIEEFRSSHLTGDLIESLRPEVAREVCADLPSGVSRARRACEQLRKVPVAEATASSKDVTAGTAQSSAVAAPTQPIETQPIGGMAPAPATAGAVAVAPRVVAPAVEGQSETGAPPTTAAGSTKGAATAAAESAPSSSNLPQPATTSPTPIKSKPVVYVRSDSGANILAQAMDGSAIIGTASSNAPLTVLGRDRNWLKVLVPGMTNRAGWIHTSSTAKIMAAGPVVRIWLSSRKSRELAEREWRMLQAAYGDLLSNLAPIVRQVDLGPDTGGNWYRIYAGPLASTDEAQALCKRIKSQPPKRNCLMVVE